MSPQLRAQYEQFVGDLYEQLVERIAADLASSVGRHRLAVAVTSQLAASADALPPKLPHLVLR